MTKNDVKTICEADDELQWWAMVLFAEISDTATGYYGKDPDVIVRTVMSKVEEFPRLVIQRQKEIAEGTVKEEVSLEQRIRVIEEKLGIDPISKGA